MAEGSTVTDELPILIAALFANVHALAVTEVFEISYDELFENGARLRTIVFAIAVVFTPTTVARTVPG